LKIVARAAFLWFRSLLVVSIKPVQVDMVLTNATLHIRERTGEFATKVACQMPFLGYGRKYIHDLIFTLFCRSGYGALKSFSFSE
jgi:hypothetical protein